MNPEKHLLANVEWQFFCTLTFKSLKVNQAVWLKIYSAVIREQAENFGVHFSDILWCLRYELGEATGRPHFHALIAGFPNSGVTVATCFSLMKIWEKHGGGNPRVRVYDPTLAGVEYVLKGVDEAFTTAGANWYELNKFGERCDVMLSMSVIRQMDNRSRFGHRGLDGLFNHDLTARFCGKKRRYSRNRLSRHKRPLELHESRGTDMTGDTKQSGVRLFRG